MFKSKCTKLGSIGIVMVLLLGMLVLPTSAEEDNLFTNPEFYITDNDGRKTIPGWSLYGTAAIENVLTPDDALYDETVNKEGNIFHSKTNGAGLISAGYLELNENGSALISVWYKSSSKNAIRFVIEGYDDNDTKVEDVNEYLPSTEGVWSKHEYKFTSSKSATKVRVIIRLVNYTEKVNDESIITGSVENGNIFFMAPYYSTEIPKVYIPNSDFESGNVDGWTYVSSTDKGRGSLELAQETNGNYYLKITTNGENACRVQGKSSSTDLFEHGKTYKLTFKFLPLTEGSTPTLAVYGLNKNGYQVSTLSASAVSLNTPEIDKWTEYVCYVVLTGEAVQNDAGTIEEKRLGKAEMMQFQIRANGNHAAGYDDFKIAHANNNAMIYQNGLETTTLTSGAVHARYHNISDAESKFVMVLYELSADGKTKTLKEISVVTANADMAAAADDAVIDTITVPNEGNYQVKAFALNEMTSLTPIIKAKTANTASAA